MALYPFQARDGSVVDLEYPMAAAPDLGVRRKINGKVYQRVWVIPRFGVHVGKPVDHDRLNSSLSAPSENNAKIWGIPPPEDGYNADGTARFRSTPAKKRYAERAESPDGNMIFDG
jgi:hypothetical protein